LNIFHTVINIFLKAISYTVTINNITINYGAEEDRLHEVALTAMKVANDPHLLPYSLSRMVDRGDGKKSDTYDLPDSQHHVNQGLRQQQL